MKKVTLGKNLETGDKFTLDIPSLLKSRLIIQASSGGGKSWAIRKLIEETHGEVQQIVLDIEDDFSSLREKYDFVLAGKGGDIAAEPRTAEILARKALELKADLIVNLYELKQYDRVRFVKLFLDAMVNAPKDLWHPVLIVLDEAHHFAPEKNPCESTGAVIDMESRGRKRGFCLVPATQRPAKLNKDVTAECQNKLIGLANQDIDRKRAADEIGFSDRASLMSLRDLEAGEFFAVGPAFGRGVMKVKIGDVKTTHHEAGRIVKSRVAMPTKKVTAILSKLTDLPKEAEEDLSTKEALTGEVRKLKRELREAKTQVKVETKVEKIRDPKIVKESLKGFKKKLFNIVQKAQLEFVQKISSEFKREMGLEISSLDIRQAPTNVSIRIPEPVAPQLRARLKSVEVGDGTLGRCERAILKFLGVRQDHSFNKTQIGAMTQYSPGSGGFNNALSKLASQGLIIRAHDQIRINNGAIEKVKEILGHEYSSPEPDALVGWLSKLGKCERVIFEHLKDADQAYSKSTLGELTGYSASSGGFNNALSRLSTLGLIERRSDGTISVNSEILDV